MRDVVKLSNFNAPVTEIVPALANWYPLTVCPVKNVTVPRVSSPITTPPPPTALLLSVSLLPRSTRLRDVALS